MSDLITAIQSALVCPDCGTEIAPSLLCCPNCRRLTHGDALRELAGEARDGQPADHRDPAAGRQKGWIAAAGALLVSVLAKGKLLLLGLTKASTFFTMLLSMGVYWTAFGWKFAVGLVVSIYIHEMGHVAALR